MNDTETIIKYLKLYNEWRRGDEKMGQPNPTEIGKLIDEACEKLVSLERERDEARNDLEFRRELYRVQGNYLEQARKERDEARARVEIITPSKNNPVAEFFSSSSTPETDAAVKDSNGQWSFVLKETCQRLERERDEAREHLSAAKHFLEKFISERDEALEEVKHWKDMYRTVSTFLK